jgi:hypothetical protein
MESDHETNSLEDALNTIGPYSMSVDLVNHILRLLFV